MRFFQYIILIAACYALTLTHGTHAIAKACEPNKQPSWLTTPQIDETCYYGINSAQFSGNQPDDDTIQKAKDRAIRDLSYSLSVNIQSYFEKHLSEYDDNSVKSSLMLSSRLVLDGIREKDHWTDCNQHAYWMMVGIDKQKADKQVRDQNFITVEYSRKIKSALSDPQFIKPGSGSENAGSGCGNAFASDAIIGNRYLFYCQSFKIRRGA